MKSADRVKTKQGNIFKIKTIDRATKRKITRYELKLRRRLPDGSVIDYQKRFNSQRAAEQDKVRVEAEIMAGTFEKPRRCATVAAEPEKQAQLLTVAEGLQLYIDHLKKTKAFGLSKRMENELKAIGARPVGSLLVSELDGTVVDNYVEERKKDGVKHATIHKERALLRRFRKTAGEELGIAGIAPDLRGTIGLRKSEARTRRPSGGELEQILAWLETHDKPVYWAARLAVATACRQGELASARWADLDQTGGVLWLAAGQTKTKRQRGVPLLTEALQTLAAAPRDLGDRRELVLGGIDAYRIATGWRRACKACGVENLRFHDLRREAISRLASLGLADRQLQVFSGHTQASMLSIYTVLNPAALALQVRQIEQQRIVTGG